VSNLHQTLEQAYVEDSPQGGFSLQSILTLPVLLRAAGSLVLLSAMSLFLFQHWDSGDDLHRYWILLGFNAFLALAGFAIGRMLGEAKGARTFLMLALVAIPINFTIMGAFIYTIHPLDAFSAHYPQFATWRIGEDVSLVTPMIVGALVAATVSWLGFLVLARDSATSLMTFSLLANSMLLLPIRGSNHIAWLLLALVPLLIHFVQRITRSNPSMKTFEGRIAALLILLPAGLILGRTLWFYSVDSFLLLVLALMVWRGLRYLGKSDTHHKIVGQGIDLLSLLIVPIIALLFASLGIERWEVDYTAAIHLFSYTVAVLYFERSWHRGNTSGRYRQIAAYALVAGALATMLFSASITYAVLSIANGLLVLATGYLIRNRSVMLMGLIALTVGVGYQLWHAVVFFDLGGWGSLAVIGSLTILIGSLVEKYSVGIKMRLQGLSGRIRDWES
jgi:hypothetical protein